MENKELALQKLREYYAEFVRMNEATQPGRVKSIQYFLDWLKTAKPSDVTSCKSKSFFLRRCDFQARLFGFKTSGDTRYTREFTAEYAGFIVSDPELPKFVSNYYYNPSADKTCMPAEIGVVANGEGKAVFYSNFPDFVFEKAKIISWTDGAPVRDTYLDCTVTYPDHKKQKTYPLRFIVYENRCFMGKQKPKSSGGCYIATSVYGSYDCPEVWTLRRYRDRTLASNPFGRAFIRIYYAVSPALVSRFGEREWFKKLWKRKLDKMVKKLNEKGVEGTPYED